MRNLLAAIAILIIFSPTPLKAGLWDWKNNVALLKQIEQMKSEYKLLLDQYDTLQAQLKSIQDVKNKLSGVSDLKDLNALINDKNIKQFLPDSVLKASGKVNQLLKDGTRFKENLLNLPKKSASENYNDYYNKFFATERQNNIDRLQDKANVIKASYASFTARLKVIEQLQTDIGKAATAKEIADIQAVIQSESLRLQNDMLKLNAFKQEQELLAKSEELKKQQFARDLFKRIAEDGERYVTKGKK